MKQFFGDVWEYQGSAIIVVPTNGDVKSNGLAVMGAGIAKQAAQKYPLLPRQLAGKLRLDGNHVHHFGDIVTFPTKHHWKEDADLVLIERSARELRELYDNQPRGAWRSIWELVVMPRVGCGLGRLVWSEVEPVLDKYLGDPFVVVSLPEMTEAPPFAIRP